MRNYNLYAKLELIPRDRAIATKSLKNKLASWGKSLVNFFAGSMEPCIIEKRDCEGKAYFWVDDPYNRSRQIFDSEAELRAWLEQRYYQ